MTKTPRTLAFIALRAGTGKTTLIEAVIALLGSKGYRVGTVKHSNHEVSVDKAGSDSWRFTRAGSEVTVLAAKGQLAAFRTVREPSLDDALKVASQGTDIVLVEGFKEMPVRKIEVYRSGHSRRLYCKELQDPDPDIVAVASDIPLDLHLPILNLNDPDEICEFIIERFINEKDP